MKKRYPWEWTEKEIRNYLVSLEPLSDSEEDELAEESRKLEKIRSEALSFISQVSCEMWDYLSESEEKEKTYKIKRRAILKWESKIFSQLSTSIRSFYKKLLSIQSPIQVIEGMTWEGSLAYQEMAAGELKIFPPKIPLPGFEEEISVIFFQKENEWFARLSDTQNFYMLFLSFLKETIEVGRLEIVSGDASEIPQEWIDNSDRFIILQQET